MLLQNNAPRSDSLLFYATQRGYDKVMDVLVKNGADINNAKSQGKTVLQTAIENGNYYLKFYTSNSNSTIDKN